MRWLVSASCACMRSHDCRCVSSYPPLQTGFGAPWIVCAWFGCFFFLQPGCRSRIVDASPFVLRFPVRRRRKHLHRSMSRFPSVSMDRSRHLRFLRRTRSSSWLFLRTLPSSHVCGSSCCARSPFLFFLRSLPLPPLVWRERSSTPWRWHVHPFHVRVHWVGYSSLARMMRLDHPHHPARGCPPRSVSTLSDGCRPQRFERISWDRKRIQGRGPSLPSVHPIPRNESMDVRQGGILCDTRKRSRFFWGAEQGRSTVPCPSRRATPPPIEQAERSTTCERHQGKMRGTTCGAGARHGSQHPSVRKTCWRHPRKQGIKPHATGDPGGAPLEPMTLEDARNVLGLGQTATFEQAVGAKNKMLEQAGDDYDTRMKVRLESKPRSHPRVQRKNTKRNKRLTKRETQPNT